MTYDLAVLVPSRNRPRAVRELAQTFTDTCVSNTLLVVLVDDDDVDLDEYCRDAEEIGTYELCIGPRRRIGPTLNWFAPEFARKAFAVGFMGDDHRPRTVGWDAAYVTSLRNMGYGVVYGDDLIMGEQIPTQVAMTSNIVLATGRFVPDGMIHLWLDNAWKSLGEALGKLRYLPHVVVEHMHPIAGKGEWDASYRENNADEVFDADHARYLWWRENELPLWVEQIRDYDGD